jgi:hypothetical protein
MNTNIKNIKHILSCKDTELRGELENWLESLLDQEYDKRLTEQVTNARRGWNYYFTKIIK